MSDLVFGAVVTHGFSTLFPLHATGAGPDE
jgi:hypothetical protein